MHLGTITESGSGSRCLFDVSGRLAIMGWFCLATVAFTLLLGTVALSKMARRCRARARRADPSECPSFL